MSIPKFNKSRTTGTKRPVRSNRKPVFCARPVFLRESGYTEEMPASLRLPSATSYFKTAVEHACRQVSELGYRGIELAPSRSAKIRRRYRLRRRKELAPAMAGEGSHFAVCIAACHAALDSRRGRDEDRRKRSWDYVGRLMISAATCDCFPFLRTQS